jgi:hypothetical protein
MSAELLSTTVIWLGEATDFTALAKKSANCALEL